MADKKSSSGSKTKSTSQKFLVLGKMKTLEDLENFVIKHFQKSINAGIVGSTDNIEEYLEYLTKRDDNFTDRLFEDTVFKLQNFLQEKGEIYKMGDLKSYQERVSSKGFISQNEYTMLENLAGVEEDDLSVSQLEEIISKKGARNVQFRDTEFPVNNKTGRYILPS